MTLSEVVRRRVATCAGTAAATLVAVVALFAWDTEKTRGADGQLHGPYEAWQGVSMVAVLFAVAVWTSVGREPLLGATAAAAATWVGVIVVAVAQGGDDGRFIGAFLGAVFAALVFGGVSGVGYTSAYVMSRREQRLPPA